MVDTRGILDGLTELTDQLTAGAVGPPALQRVVELAERIAGASGAAFVEYGPDQGRVVAVAGELTWTLGRPIDTSHPGVRRVLEGDRIQEFDSVDLGTVGGQQLIGLGLPRMVRIEPTVDGTAVGVLALAFPDHSGQLDATQRSAVVLLAGFIANLYANGGGLPVFEDGPVVGGAKDGFAVLGPDRRVRQWSNAAALLTARSAEQAIGQPWPFPYPENGDSIEHQMPCGRWIEIRAAPMPGTDTTAVSFRPRPDPTGHDNRDLFIALTGHELRTPVTVIRGYSDTLVEHWDSLDDNARREAVYVVGQRARELARLVDRMLNAATLASGPNDAPLAGLPFDLIDALREATRELASELRQLLRVELPVSLPKAVGDRTSLVTVLTELVTNAGKYSPNRVQVELTAGADAQTVWFRVADRGVGIRPEHVERAFERFWQLQTGDQRRSGGVGLGLYLVRRIVEKQHGWVSLRPRRGGGTVAEVRLPRADATHGEA
jgi:signal transduction histidine kinase